MPKSVCVIGAGPSGMNAARYSIEAGFQVTVYEQTNLLGGLWNYTDETNVDHNGLPIHTSMYSGLRTNTPKEVMGFKDYPMPDQNKSYITQAEVLEFLHSYARDFNLANVIKFEHHVIRVTPHGDTQWEVIVRNFLTQLYTTEIFDFVFVCTGRFWKAYFPNIDGMANFTGSQIHSRSYRKVDPYRGQKVLIVGAGPSAFDIAKQLTPVAESITLSFDLNKTVSRFPFPDSVVQKPRIYRIHRNDIEFNDGTVGQYTKIIYCTGYKTSFPFLSVDCEVAMDGLRFRPIYKHIININRPTMAFIGQFVESGFPGFDLQCRFAMKFFSGTKNLPTKEKMLEDSERQIADLKDKTGLATQVEQYSTDLAVTAEIDPIKPYVIAIFRDHLPRFLSDLHFEKYYYRILNDNNFEVLSHN